MNKKFKQHSTNYKQLNTFQRLEYIEKKLSSARCKLCNISTSTKHLSLLETIGILENVKLILQSKLEKENEK